MEKNTGNKDKYNFDVLDYTVLESIKVYRGTTPDWCQPIDAGPIDADLIDARPDWCQGRPFDASPDWCPSQLMSAVPFDARPH